MARLPCPAAGPYDTGMGPLQGVRILELAGIGPGPFCAMLLADLGAEVLAVERPAAGQPGWPTLFGRGRRRVAVDLKHPTGRGWCSTWSPGPTRWSRGSAPGWPSGSASGPRTAWPATRGWSTGG